MVEIEQVHRVKLLIGTQVMDEDGKQKTLLKDFYVLCSENALQSDSVEGEGN